MNQAYSGLNLVNLPEEILGIVFSSSLLEDRKHIRLTCRRFYEACNTFHIQKTEEIALYGNINSIRALLSLCNSKRKFWNIKLNEMKLNSSILPFFAQNGSHVYSLTLCNCSLKDGVLRDMIAFCSLNLRSCAFIYNIPDDSYVKRHDLYEGIICKAFIGLASLRYIGTICSQVIDFTLILYMRSEIQFSDNFFPIFNIFPNIKKLDLRVYINSYFDERSCDKHMLDKVFSYSCIHKQIMKMSHKLENLSLYLRYLDGLSRFSIDTWNKFSNIEMENLKHLSLSLISPKYRDIFINNTVLTLKNLTSLDCVIVDHIFNDRPNHDRDDRITQSSFANILLILSSAPNLHYLTLRFRMLSETRVCINKKIFEALVRSKLIIIKMLVWERCLRFSDFPRPRRALINDFPHLTFFSYNQSSYDQSLTPNLTLKQLKVPIGEGHLLSLFSLYFKNLEYVQLQKVDNSVLSMLENQKQLKSLCIDVFEEEFSPPSRVYQFDNLTHLRVILRDLEESQFPLSMLSRYRLPKLKSLSIEKGLTMYSPKQDEFESFWKAIQTFIQLEFLLISVNYPIKFHQWLTLFQALPKLRHFLIWVGGKLEDVEYKLPKSLGVNDSQCRQLFHLYPALRTIVITFYANSFKRISYFKDIIKNKIVCKWLPPDVAGDRFEGEEIPYHYYNLVPAFKECSDGNYR